MSFLDWVYLLDQLTLDERNELSNFCQIRTILKGETLFTEWDEANAMYILKTGAVNIYKTIQGKQTSLGLVQAQEILWEMALFVNDGKRMGSAVATEDTEVIILISFSVKRLIEQNAMIMEKIQKIINERVSKNKVIEEKIKGI